MHPHTLETGHTCIVDNRTDKWNGLCIQCSANFLMEANTDVDARNDVAHMLAECFTCLSHEYKFEVVDKMILNTVQRLFREVQMRNDVREAEVRNVLRWISVMNIPDRLASETAIIAVIIASISECFRNSYRLMNGAGKVNCELWVYFGILRLCLQVSASKLQDFACNASCRSDLLKTMRRGFFGADGRTEGLLGVLQCLLRRDSSDLTVALCDVAMRVEGVAVVVQVLASDTGLSSISAPRCSATCLELVDSLLRELASDHSGMLKELTAEGAGSYPADPRHLNNDTMCWYRSQLMELIGILISLAEAQQVGEYFTAQRLSKQRLHLLASSAVALLSHQLDALEKNHKANTAHSAPQISNRSCDAGLRCLLRLMALTSSSAAGSEFSRSATPVATQLLADDCNYSSKLFALYERYACIGSTADPESVVVESLHALTAACPGRFFHYSLFSQRMQQVLLQQFLTSVTEAVVLSVVSDWKPELGADGLSRKSTTPVGEGERLQHLHLQGILVLAIRRRALTGSSLQDLVAGCGKLISSRFQICSTQHYYSGAVSTLAILNGVLPLLHEVVAGAIPQASVRTKTISKHLCAQPVADATQQLNHTLHLVVLEALKLLVLVLQTVDADGVLRTNLRGSVHSVVLYSMRCCTALSSRNYVSTGITASMEDTLAAQRDCAHLLSYALRLLGDKGENLSGDEVDACRTKNALFAAVVDLQQLDCLGMGELSRRGFDCRFLHHHMAVYAARQHFLHRRGRGSVSFSGIDVPNTDADYTKHIAALTMGSLNLNSKNSTSRSAIQSVDVFSFLDKTATASGRSEPSEIARLCIQAIGSPHLPLHVLQQSALLYLAACLDPSGAALSCFGFVVCPGPVLAEGGEGTEVEAAGQRQHSTALLALALAQLHDPPLICRLYQNVVRWVLDVASPQAHDLNPALCAVLLTFAVLCGGAICSSSSSICSLVRGTDAHILREYWSCCLSPTATEVSAVSDTKFTEHSLCWDSTTQEQGTQKSFTCPEEELLPVLLDRCAHMLLLSGAADANLQVAKFVLEVVRAVPTAAFSEHTSTALVSASLMLMQASAESCSTAASSVWWQALLVATARMLTTTHYTHQMNLRSEKHQGQEDERTAAADTASRTVLKTLSMLMLMSDNAPCVSVSWLTSLEQDQPTAEALRQLALSQCASDCCSAMRAWVTTGTNCSLRSQLSHCMRCNREW